MQVGEHRLLHQFGMQRRNAVDAVGADKGEVAHAHTPLAAFLDQRDAADLLVAEAAGRAGFEQHLGVDRVDDLHVARQQALEQRHRPAFQRFGQQRVVGVGECPLGGVPGLVEVDAMDVHEEPHQFGDSDRRMRVVEMDRRLVRQRQQIAELAEVPLRRCPAAKPSRRSTPAAGAIPAPPGWSSAG